jgi:hypothetical protein
MCRYGVGILLAIIDMTDIVYGHCDISVLMSLPGQSAVHGMRECGPSLMLPAYISVSSRISKGQGYQGFLRKRAGSSFGQKGAICIAQGKT